MASILYTVNSAYVGSDFGVVFSPIYATIRLRRGKVHSLNQMDRRNQSEFGDYPIGMSKGGLGAPLCDSSRWASSQNEGSQIESVLCRSPVRLQCGWFPIFHQPANVQVCTNSRHVCSSSNASGRVVGRSCFKYNSAHWQSFKLCTKINSPMHDCVQALHLFHISNWGLNLAFCMRSIFQVWM